MRSLTPPLSMYKEEPVCMWTRFYTYEYICTYTHNVFMVVVCLHNKIHICSCNGLLVIAPKPTAKDNFSQLPFYFTFYRKLSSVLHIFENL
jgi:hypothetical protein